MTGSKEGWFIVYDPWDDKKALYDGEGKLVSYPLEARDILAHFGINYSINRLSEKMPFEEIEGFFKYRDKMPETLKPIKEYLEVLGNA